MPPRKTYKYREVLRKLKQHDKRFEEYVQRGKGSHRMLYHPDVLGRPASYPIPCHGGGDDVRDVYLRAIIRRFNLPADFF
ncbi:MAG: type II toxin-antitoxin system HicA family toxin [Pseudomonadota bacterium]|nr:type II toxin-antitoxin system HicA family toxin [Pseudomonadota bacterium]